MTTLLATSTGPESFQGIFEVPSISSDKRVIPQPGSCTGLAVARQSSLRGRRAGGHRFERGLLMTGRRPRQTPPRATPSQGRDAVPAGSQRDCGLRSGRAGLPRALQQLGHGRGSRFATGRDARIGSAAAKGTTCPESVGTSHDFPRRSRCRVHCPPVPKSPADCEYEPPAAQLRPDLRVSAPAHFRGSGTASGHTTQIQPTPETVPEDRVLEARQSGADPMPRELKLTAPASHLARASGRTSGSSQRRRVASRRLSG